MSEQKQLTLSQIQQKLKVPKGNFNSFGKYKFRNCDDILEKLKPFLDGWNLNMSDEILLIGDRFYIKSTVTLSNKDGAIHTATGLAREALSQKGMAEAQITGAASSYARKTALSGLFALDDSDVTDQENKPLETNIARFNGKPETSAQKHPELASTMITVGKHKGKTFLEVGATDLMSYINYIESNSTKALTGPMLKLSQDAKKWTS